ncbi:MAG: FAD-binding domain [Verrucomicrobiota bacterium]
MSRPRLKIAINGCGIAGPALAWWLRYYGHEPVLFERSPELRRGGYFVDFWGVGYDVAEKMGLLPTLQARSYQPAELRLVNAEGKRRASLDLQAFKSLTDGRAISILRSDLAVSLFEACEDIPSRFGLPVTACRQTDQGVEVRLSDGSAPTFDLLIGADGLHSRVRRAAFGSEQKFLHPLGYRVAAFSVRGYRPREEGVYLGHTEPGRQAMRISLRGDRTVFLLIFREDVVPPEALDQEPKVLLREVFGGMGWEVPHFLPRLEEAVDFYYDTVSQIRMPRWSKGRVGLIGDAAACASLLAGEGAGLAIAEAYILAGELHRARGDHEVAFARYEERVRPFLERKQRAAEKMCGFFAPKARRTIWLRDLAVNLSNRRWLARLLSGSTVRDQLELPDYASP